MKSFTEVCRGAPVPRGEYLSAYPQEAVLAYHYGGEAVSLLDACT
jgi:hypothetical protein